MQNNVFYMKLFSLSATMILFSNCLYAKEVHSLKKATNIDKNISFQKIMTISDTENIESEELTHHVIMSSRSNISKNYNFELTDGPSHPPKTLDAIAGVDYDTTPSFSTDKVRFENGKVIVDANVKEFDIKIRSKANADKKSDTTYTIRLGSKTATGKIKNIDP